VTYQFPAPRGAKVKVSRAAPKFTPESIEPAVLGPIQGKRAGSREEWRLAMALGMLRIDFAYQVGIMGGRRFAGGQVVDFVLYIPWAQPVQVFGQYWHSGDEVCSLANIQRVYGRPALVAWDYELRSIRDAVAWIKRSVL